MSTPQRELDKRYKPGTDTGAMSYHKVELPLDYNRGLNKPSSVTPNIDKQNRIKASEQAKKRYKSDMKAINRKNKLKTK
jgi:hypothetical protein